MKTVESSRQSESSDAVVTVVEFIGRSVGCKEEHRVDRVGRVWGQLDSEHACGFIESTHPGRESATLRSIWRSECPPSVSRERGPQWYLSVSVLPTRERPSHARTRTHSTWHYYYSTTPTDDSLVQQCWDVGNWFPNRRSNIVPHDLLFWPKKKSFLSSRPVASCSPRSEMLLLNPDSPFYSIWRFCIVFY